MNSIRLKAKELLRFHFGCHGNQVTIAMSYVADAYHPKEPHTICELNGSQNKGVIEVSLWLPWQLSYHSNMLCGDAYHPKEPPYKYEIITT